MGACSRYTGYVIDAALSLALLILCFIEMGIGPAASAPDDMCSSDPTYCFLSLYVLVAGAVNVVFLLVAASFELLPRKSPICQKALLVPTCLCMVGWWAYGTVMMLPLISDGETCKDVDGRTCYYDSRLLGTAAIEWTSKLSLPVIKWGHGIMDRRWRASNQQSEVSRQPQGAMVGAHNRVIEYNQYNRYNIRNVHNEHNVVNVHNRRHQTSVVAY